MVTNNEIMQTSDYLKALVTTQWLNEQFLSPIWFGLVFLILFSYALVFFLMDKKRITEILLYGSLVAVALIVYDSIGSYFGLWVYLINILPIMPNYFASHLTLIPLYAMLVYQYTFSWKTYLLWITVWAVLFIFGFYNYALTNLGVFTYLTPWAKYVDFTLLLLEGIIARGILVTLLGMEAKRGNMASKASLSNLIAQPALKPSGNLDDEDKE
ncbi:MAG: hypothetical protein A4E53_03279 [Pelotomaculum sp. PtaB.Bin104]|nr:MAG: hypothetical protein A4E53_03279 [Pelotomaculum sp. PtaB.Bin104]